MNRKKARVLLLVGWFFGLNNQVLSAQSENLPACFDEGVTCYIEGDLEKAVQNLELALKQEPANPKIKSYLVKVLVELGSQLYFESKYQTAEGYLGRAKELNPTDENVARMLALVKDKLSPSRPAPPVEEKPATTPSRVVRPAESRTMQTLLDSFRQQQQSLEKELDRQTRTIVESVTESKTALKETIGWGFSGLILLGLLTVGVFLGLIFYFQKRREKMALAHERKVLEILQNQSSLLPPGSAVPEPARLRTKGVEVIEAEFVEEEKETAQRLLTPFLEDQDHSVQARAVQALYKYDAGSAWEKLRKMTASSEVSQRLSVIPVLANLAVTPPALDLLLQLCQDPEVRVKGSAGRLLKKLFFNKEKEISAEMREKIKKTLESFKQEKWVI